MTIQTTLFPIFLPKDPEKRRNYQEVPDTEPLPQNTTSMHVALMSTNKYKKN